MDACWTGRVVLMAAGSVLSVQTGGAQESATNASVAPGVAEVRAEMVPSNAVPVAATNRVLTPVPVEVSPVPPVSAGIPGDWRVGTRYLLDSLQDRHRGTEFNGSFVGTLTELKNKQDDVPDKLFGQGRIMDSPVWIGVSYDRVLAKTWEGNRPAGLPGNTDGNVDLRGVIPYVQGEWDNSTPFTPYLDAGPCFYQSKFDADSNWANGGQRQISLGNAKGWEVSGGTGIRVYKNWSADLYVRYTHINDVAGIFYNFGRFQGNAVFTMSYLAVGVGVTCDF